MSKTLLDPKHLCDTGNSEYDFDLLNEKLGVAKMIIARSPQKKGFPFIFAFASTKTHNLEDIKMPIYTDDNGNVEYFHSAATDGSKYYWSPGMLNRLDPFELAIVMCHETYHIVLQHCDMNRVSGKDKKIWNIAVDYVVNSMIEHDARNAWKDMNVHDNYRGKIHPIWGGNLGSPLYFDELLKSIDSQKKEIENYRKTLKSGKAPNVPPPQKKKSKPSLKDIKMYADYSQYNRSAEDIYNEIMEHLKGLDNEAVEAIIESMGAKPMDDHPDTDISRPKLLEEILQAAQATKQLAGTVPASIEDQLLKLQEPKLSWQDIVRTSLQMRRQEKGNVNDWSRFRRRPLSVGQAASGNPFYSPKKKDNFVRWLAMLDTSGSMSQDDMTYGISQLKCLDGRSEGIVVSCDTQCYWEKATKIHSMNDLPTINPVGRGGTAFSDFFDNWKKKTLKDFDVIIILTDGGIWDIEQLKRPSCDVVWVLTNDYKDFKPSFGRVAPLRGF